MAYERLNLKDGDVLTAEHLKHIEDGIDGIKPVKTVNGVAPDENGNVNVIGNDYVLTDDDKEEIAALAAIKIKDGGVIGVVDENNNIIVSGNLADGTYTLKYEMENGSTVNIGDLVLDSNVYYAITKNLTNCSISNSATSIVEGESYSATISANSGYELKTVSVTMGGANVSVTNGVINIASVTGNIVITAVAEEKQAAEPITENITVTKEMSIVVGTGADRANTQSYCATPHIDVSNIPKPCVINLKQTRWAMLNASDTGYVRFYIADKNGTKLASDYTHSSKMPSGVTMECNNGDNYGYDDITVTVTSDNVGTLRFSGYYVYDGTGVASEPLVTLTYTPES